ERELAREREAAAKAEREAQVAALRKLRPRLERANREPVSADRGLDRLAAGAVLPGQGAGGFHQMLPGISPRWDALERLHLEVATLPTTNPQTGRAWTVPFNDPAMLAELDAIECAVWRAQVDLARVIAGEVDEPPEAKTGWR